MNRNKKTKNNKVNKAIANTGDSNSVNALVDTDGNSNNNSKTKK